MLWRTSNLTTSKIDKLALLSEIPILCLGVLMGVVLANYRIDACKGQSLEKNSNEEAIAFSALMLCACIDELLHTA